MLWIKNVKNVFFYIYAFFHSVWCCQGVRRVWVTAVSRRWHGNRVLRFRAWQCPCLTAAHRPRLLLQPSSPLNSPLPRTARMMSKWCHPTPVAAAPVMNDSLTRHYITQETQLMLTNRATRLEVTPVVKVRGLGGGLSRATCEKRMSEGFTEMRHRRRQYLDAKGVKGSGYWGGGVHQCNFHYEN